jgi:hypothetical protein
MRKLIPLLLIVALIVAAGIAAADGPVLWKEHCPRHYTVDIVPAVDWDGVHVICTRAALEETKRP